MAAALLLALTQRTPDETVKAVSPPISEMQADPATTTTAAPGMQGELVSQVSAALDAIPPPTTVPPPPTTSPPAPPTPPPVAVQPSTGGTGYADPNNPATWDRLAQCEAWGDWHINTGNGYYGGLQFALGSWQSVGGTGYPHEASRETQIAMGQRLWASGGWAHWPACSIKLGYR